MTREKERELTDSELKKIANSFIELCQKEAHKELPPVNPQPKTGHWIIVDDCEKFIAKCSVCGRIEDSRMVHKYPYCHCGAKMIEP